MSNGFESLLVRRAHNTSTASTEAACKCSKSRLGRSAAAATRAAGVEVTTWTACWISRTCRPRHDRLVLGSRRPSECFFHNSKAPLGWEQRDQQDLSPVVRREQWETEFRVFPCEARKHAIDGIKVGKVERRVKSAKQLETLRKAYLIHLKGIDSIGQ
jgi:hypothetical protein